MNSLVYIGARQTYVCGWGAYIKHTTTLGIHNIPKRHNRNNDTESRPDHLDIILVMHSASTNHQSLAFQEDMYWESLHAQSITPAKADQCPVDTNRTRVWWMRSLWRMDVTTLDNLLKEMYRVLDARNHREPAEYMLNIMSHSKDFNQLIFAYKGIDAEMKQAIKASTPDTTVNKFMDQWEERKIVWWILYDGRHQTISNSNGQTANVRSISKPHGSRC